jgi:hypothetical protein
MAAPTKPELYVVDGSNIATEGRSTPSLEQLNEAVLAFMEAHPHATVTVVVDATFGHRIAKKEVKAFDEAVANNELVTPPAGAVGRGDAFVLGDRRPGQGRHPVERLVPGVPRRLRVAVRRRPSHRRQAGPARRLGVREAPPGARTEEPQGHARLRSRAGVRRRVEPLAVDDGSSRRGRGRTTGAVTGQGRARRRVSRCRCRRSRPPGRSSVDPSTGGERIGDDPRPTEAGRAPAPASSSSVVNELMPFLEFVEHHPVGTSVNAIVESYSSHGAYVSIGPVRGLRAAPADGRSAPEERTRGDEDR